jgi:hypothetical protein
MVMALRFGLALIKKRLVAASRNHEYLGLIPDVSCTRKLLKASEEKDKSNHIKKTLMKAANAMSVRNHDMFEPNGINHRLIHGKHGPQKVSWFQLSSSNICQINYSLPCLAQASALHGQLWWLPQI